MRLSTWIGERTMDRFNRIMQASGFVAYNDGTDGAYLSNVLNHYPAYRHEAKCALAKAIAQSKTSVTYSDALDANDLRSPIEIEAAYQNEH